MRHTFNRILSFCPLYDSALFQRTDDSLLCMHAGFVLILLCPTSEKSVTNTVVSYVNNQEQQSKHHIFQLFSKRANLLFVTFRYSHKCPIFPITFVTTTTANDRIRNCFQNFTGLILNSCSTLTMLTYKYQCV